MTKKLYFKEHFFQITLTVLFVDKIRKVIIYLKKHSVYYRFLDKNRLISIKKY